MTVSGIATLLRGGLLFDGQRLLPHMAVLIEGERIVAVGPVAQFTGHAGPVIDTTGGTLLPMLIDAHVHMLLPPGVDAFGQIARWGHAEFVIQGVENLRVFLEGGIAAVRDMSGQFYLEMKMRDALAAGRLAGPLLRCAGKHIIMTGGHVPQTGRIADGPDEVRKATREQIGAGADHVKIMASGGVFSPHTRPQDSHLTQAEIAACVEEAHRFGRPVASHAIGADSVRNAVNAGVDSIEHGFWIDDEIIALMVERRTWLVPTLSVTLGGFRYHRDLVPDFAVPKLEAAREAHLDSFSRAYRAGVRIAMGTDFPNIRKGETLAQELAYMVEAGMTALDALIAGTANGAELLGLDDLGRVAPGARAALLVVEGDPTQDIARVAETRHHRLVIHRGRVLPRDPVNPPA
jgi:imidazolonepropionase-like amidohydrolase